MADKARREVELALSITTANAESLRKLRDDVRELAKEGGAAAPEFQRLAQELEQLAQQAKQLQSMEDLSATLAEARTAQQGLSEASEKLAAELHDLALKTDEARQAQRAKQEELERAKLATQAASDAIRTLKKDTEDSEKTTNEYRANLHKLTTEWLESREATRTLKSELAALTKETQDAASKQGDLAKQYREANTQTQGAARHIADLQAQYEQLQQKLLAAGSSTGDLAQAQKNVQDAMLRTRDALREVIEEQDRAAAAAAARAEQEEREAFQTKANAAAYANWWNEALRSREESERQVAEATKQAAQATQEAADKINGALKATGADGARQLEREITEVRQAMQLLGDSGTVTGAELERAMRQGDARIKELERSLREASGQMTLMDRASKGLQSTVGQIGVFVSLYEVVTRTATAFWEATKRIETLRLGLTQIYGSAQVAAQQIEVLRAAANSGGVAIGEITSSFVKFAASAQASNIPVAEANELFASLTRAAGTLGLSSEKVNQALEALGQMAGKGVVNMEELRQQLGDALPGALSLVSKGLGITQAELFKLVEAGQLTARDLFPALNASLKTLGGEVNTLAGSWARLKNATSQSLEAMGDAGITDVLRGGLSLLTGTVKNLSIVLVGLTESFFLVGRIAGAVAGTLTGGGSFSEALAAATEQANKMNERVRLFSDSLSGNATVAQAAKEKLDALAKAQSGGAQASAEATTAANNQGNAWVQLGVGVAKANEIIEQNIKVAEKAAKVAEIEMKNREALVKLTGDQEQILIANTAATQAHQVALERVATVREQEVGALRVQLEAYRLVAAQMGDPDGTRAKLIQDLEKTLQLRTEDASKARQQAEEAANLAAAAKIEQQTHADNSARLGELKTAYDNARLALDSLTLAKQHGEATDAQVNAQARLAAEAQRLYQDALADTTQRLQVKTQMQQADNAVTEANIHVRQQQLGALAALAKATGDEALALYAAVEQKRLDIKLIETKVAVMRAEANGAIEVAQATRAELAAKGELTPVKAAEIDAAIRSAEARLREADAVREGIKIKEYEILALQNGVNARDNDTRATDKNTDALRRNNSEREKSLSLLGGQKGLTADGFKQNADGSAAGTFNNMLPVDQAFALAGGGKGMTLEQARAAFKQAENAYNDMQAFRNLSPGAASLEYQQSTTQLYTRARTELERIAAADAAAKAAAAQQQQQEEARSKVLQTSGGTYSPGMTDAEFQRAKSLAVQQQYANGGGYNPAPAPAPTAGTSHRIELVLGGQTTAVNVASSQDAAALTSFLQQLQFAKGSSA